MFRFVLALSIGVSSSALTAATFFQGAAEGSGTFYANGADPLGSGGVYKVSVRFSKPVTNVYFDVNGDLDFVVYDARTGEYLNGNDRPVFNFVESDGPVTFLTYLARTPGNTFHVLEPPGPALRQETYRPGRSTVLFTHTESLQFEASFEYLTAIPEPSTWAMMIGGFGLLGAAARRRAGTVITYAP